MSWSEPFYMQVMGSLGGSRGFTLFVSCRECGATVPISDMDLHDAFHDKLRKQACRT